jgi:hypothetical protein
VAFHFQECLDLAEGKILPVPESHQLIKGAQQLKGIPHDLALIQTLADACRDLCEQVEAVDILQDVRLPVGDENDVKFVQGLVDEAHIVLLDGGVLRARVCELGERGQKSFNS